jgi:hypothetical protein
MVITGYYVPLSPWCHNMTDMLPTVEIELQAAGLCALLCNIPELNTVKAACYNRNGVLKYPPPLLLPQ